MVKDDRMDIKELREVSEKYLVPLLSAKIEAELEDCTSNCKRVAFRGPSRIAFKAIGSDLKRLVIRRDTGFISEELQLVDDFVEEVVALNSSVEKEFRAELFSFIPLRVITRYLGGFESVRLILAQFEMWSSRTYEGGSITSSIGVDPSSQDSGVSLEDMFKQDFSAVLSNGFDTLIVANVDGELVGSGILGTVEDNLIAQYSPYRLGAITQWAEGERIALVLNRLGEQLVFTRNKLLFAKRRGEWHYYPSDTHIKQMRPPQNKELRKAIYQSCLDISYSRTGGCIIVIRSGSMSKINDYVNDKDRLDVKDLSIKSMALTAMVGDTRFKDLDRRLRQELLALDGAMVLNHKGEILAVGAIISVSSGSDGGGRTAAAKRGSELGLGIKISEDGAISVFNKQELTYSV